MSDIFEIDTMIIGADFTVNRDKNGMRGVIIEPLQYVNARDGKGNMVQAHCYMVYWADRSTTYVQPGNLRLAPEEFDKNVIAAAHALMTRLTGVAEAPAFGKK